MTSDEVKWPEQSMPQTKMHADQLEVGLGTVRLLVSEQFPRWRSLPIEPVRACGTVNALFRIGAGLAARRPLTGSDVEAVRGQLEAEAAAASQLLGTTRFATPRPVALGEPGDGYPLPWAVQTWLPGVTADRVDPSESVPFAHDLADFIKDVRAIPAGGRRFSGLGRGGDLRDHDEWMEICFENSVHLLDVPRLRRMWGAFRDLPLSPTADVMNHGDLRGGNVLVSGGRLSGVIDVGGLGPADPALDVACAWHLLDHGPRQAFREDLHCDRIEWERAKAWAFEQAMGAIWYYVESNPSMSQMGMRTLRRLLSSESHDG